MQVPSLHALANLPRNLYPLTPRPRSPSAAAQFLEDLSRRMRVSLGLITGRWGLPLPFKVKLHMVVGDLVHVRQLPRDHPEFEQAVADAHASYMEALSDLYHRHREEYGWADRPLVMV